jgi:hypothetical protein
MVRVTRPMRGLKCSTCDRRESLIVYYTAQRDNSNSNSNGNGNGNAALQQQHT